MLPSDADACWSSNHTLNSKIIVCFDEFGLYSVGLAGVT